MKGKGVFALVYTRSIAQTEKLRWLECLHPEIELNVTLATCFWGHYGSYIFCTSLFALGSALLMDLNSYKMDFYLPF